MHSISKETLERLRNAYTIGARVELISMDDPYNAQLTPGAKGSVIAIDDTGTIHVQWDCGSSLGLVYGVDHCKLL